MGGGYDAIILAGGRGSRMSGQPKPQLSVGDATMLQHVLSAVRDARIRIVVGPPQPVPDGVLVTQEQPAGAGPVAGAAAGLDQCSADVVVLVAADLPFLTPQIISKLLTAVGAEVGADVALLVDERGREQYLLGAWRVGPLRSALSGLAPLPGRAMRELVRAVRVTRIEVLAHGDGPRPWTDIDTPAELDRARRQVRSQAALSPENVRSGPGQR